MTINSKQGKDGKPKRKITRVMVDANKDAFYGSDYSVVNRESLNYFGPDENSNKFYIAEVHQSNAGLGWRLFVNYGRVGAKGAIIAEPFSSLSPAVEKFNTKVKQKMKKGYVRVDLATYSRGSEQGKKQVEEKGIKTAFINSKSMIKSSLHPKVVELVIKLYDEANRAVSLSLSGSVKSDIRAPLGNLGFDGIKHGREILAHVAKSLAYKDYDGVRNATIQYYRFIPRKLQGDLRDERKWVLNTDDRIQKELDILDLYEDTLRMLPIMGVSDIDIKYAGLCCDIVPVEDKGTVDYIKHKVLSTHAPNHNFKLKVTGAFKVHLKNAPLFDDRCGNIRRLFHGSKNANVVGILSSYLKLPYDISNVSKTGDMFGPGIYFANNSTKSANYSFGFWGNRSNKYESSYLMLCKVALGNMYKVISAHKFTQPPAGYHSVKGCRGNTLINDEFIVYNPQQVYVQYLVEVVKEK